MVPSRAVERTLIIVKPDGVERRLVGRDPRAASSARGLRLVAGGPAPDRRGDGRAALRRARGASRSSPSWWPSSPASPAFVGVLEGPADTWAIVRSMMGATQPEGRRARDDPRRPRDRAHREPHPRLGLRGVRCTRDRRLLPDHLSGASRRPRRRGTTAPLRERARQAEVGARRVVARRRARGPRPRPAGATPTCLRRRAATDRAVRWACERCSTATRPPTSARRARSPRPMPAHLAPWTARGAPRSSRRAARASTTSRRRRALRAGPRGGGRDLASVRCHVTDAEVASVHGLRDAATMGDPELTDVLGERVLGVLAGTEIAERAARWPLRSAVRRIAWHACDHLFEIEDRATRTDDLRRRRPEATTRAVGRVARRRVPSTRT